MLPDDRLMKYNESNNVLLFSTFFDAELYGYRSLFRCSWACRRTSYTWGTYIYIYIYLYIFYKKKNIILLFIFIHCPTLNYIMFRPFFNQFCLPLVRRVVVKPPAIDAANIIFDTTPGIHIVVPDPVQEIVPVAAPAGCAEPLWAVAIEKNDTDGIRIGTGCCGAHKNCFSMVSGRSSISGPGQWRWPGRFGRTLCGSAAGWGAGR